MQVVRHASDATTSNFKTRRVKAHTYAQLAKNQRDGKDWTPYYAVSATISVSLQREPSLRNAHPAETRAAGHTRWRGRASTTNTNEHHTGGDRYGN